MNEQEFLPLLFYAVNAECGAPNAPRNLNRLYRRTQSTKKALSSIESRLQEMGVCAESDFMDDICDLAEAYELQGFANGFRLGMMLQGELNGAIASRPADLSRHILAR